MAEPVTLPNVGVDMPGLIRGMLLQMWPLITLLVSGYIAFHVLRRALRFSQYYELVETKEERRQRQRVEKDWLRAVAEDRRFEARIQRDWDRAMREDLRRSRPRQNP